MMGVHGPHPDTFFHGLSDDCSECKRKAADPIAYLDSLHITDLWNRMVAVEHPSSREYLPPDYHPVRHYRTHAEGDACRHLYRVALFLERHTRIEPWYAMSDLGDFLKEHA